MEANGGSPLALTGSASSGGAKQEPLLVDAWIVQKLKNDWSSSDFGSLLSREKLSEAVAGFRLLDTAVKVRFLLSFLSMRREDVEESKFAIVEIIDAAENDTEEWVRIGAGIVKQYMFMSEDGAESGDTFFHEQIARTTARVLDAVRSTRASGSDSTTATATTLDVFSHEAAFLNPSVRLTPPTPVTTHFTVVSAPSMNGKVPASSDEKSAHERKPTLLPPHRAQLARSVTTTSTSSSSGTGSGASASTRLTPPATAMAAAKLPVPLSSARKHAPELSEIRRKADAGRFKRHRSRISMIDIDEVKQIELEKVQKAEERKKQKAASAAKEKAAQALAAAAAAAQSAEKASLNPTDEDDNGLETDATAAMVAAALSATRPTPQDDDDEDDDDHHDDEDDEEDDDDDNDATELHGLHLQQPPLRNDNEYVVADGTQALLTAAIMTEAASHQHSLQSQHAYHPHSYEPVAPPPQPLQHQYHRGFEPEDANQHQLYSSYGFAPTYASPFGDPGGYVSHQHVVPQVPPPFQLPHMQSQFGAGVFLDEPTPGPRHLPGFDPPPPPHLTSNQSHNHNNSHNNGTGGATNSGFLSGPPEYWR